MIFDLQKANMWKRISAFLFDMILLGILAVGAAFIMSEALGYDGYSKKLDGYYTAYEEKYGIDFKITQEEFEKLPDTEREKYEEANKALNSDTEALRTYSMVVNLTLLILSIGILFSYVILEFVVPLLLKNGQTLGKKVFGIGLIRTDGVKISTMSLFVRTILGKYTLETMVPVLIIIMMYFNSIGLTGTVILCAILLLQVILVSATRTNSTLHDLLAGTVVIDMASQMIFDSEDALIEYKKKRNAEKSMRDNY